MKHIAVPITTYWSKKKGTPGAQLVQVTSVDFSDPKSWERYPHAYAAIYGRTHGA